MASTKKSSSPKVKSSLTKEFLVYQLQNFETRILKNVDSKIDHARELLEAKIDFSRKDAKEQIQSVAIGVNSKIAASEYKLVKAIDSIESEVRFTQIAIREVKSDTIRIEKTQGEHTERLNRIEKKLNEVTEKVNEHDTEIATLKSAAFTG